MPEAALATSTRPIDPVISPLVNNLNRLPGLTTTSSCQGHYDRRRPHIAFTCEEATLPLILKAITILNSEEPRQVRAPFGADEIVLRGLINCGRPPRRPSRRAGSY